MQYTDTYQSPVGELLLASDGEGLTGLWTQGARYYAQGLEREHEERETPALLEARRWLDVYFSGREPDFMPPLHLIGSPFQLAVWEILRQIPYGETVTYGQIAKRLAEERGLPRTSARAVGGAVGRNRISILVPCHRVVGSGGRLTGYAGGLDKKLRLLQLEGAAAPPRGGG